MYNTKARIRASGTIKLPYDKSHCRTIATQDQQIVYNLYFCGSQLGKECGYATVTINVARTV